LVISLIRRSVHTRHITVIEESDRISDFTVYISVFSVTKRKGISIVMMGSLK